MGDGVLGQKSPSLNMAGVAEQIIPVTLGARSYDIVLHPGLLATVGDRLSALTVSPKIGVVTDRHVASRYLQGTLRSLCKAGYDPTPIILPPGERTKTLGTIAKILDVLASHKFERQSLLLALGGGVIGDVTGFAAAIYQRGIPFVQVPTTLVAQVDSSVGGKTGVDHRLGKNLIGAFYQPRAVLIDPLTLRTLPRREWIAGLASSGLDAIEVYHSNHDEAAEQRYRSMADRLGLGVSGGSDYHGDESHGPAYPGSVSLPAGDFDQLRDRATSRATASGASTSS